MKCFRISAVAGALIIVDFLAPQAMAAGARAFDVDSCHCQGILCGCPDLLPPDVLFSPAQIEALKNAPKLTPEQLQNAPAAPSSPKQ